MQAKMNNGDYHNYPLDVYGCPSVYYRELCVVERSKSTAQFQLVIKFELDKVTIHNNILCVLKYPRYSRHNIIELLCFSLRSCKWKNKLCWLTNKGCILLLSK